MDVVTETFGGGTEAPAITATAAVSRDASESISLALLAWTEINFSALQKTLDAQGLEIVENQKESNRNKKKLADVTKDFKKLNDEEKLKEFKGLLKAYQLEIDTIAKRSKTAESAFLSLYKLLAEAPDPAPLIKSLANHPQLQHELSVAQEELKALRASMAAMERDAASGKASEGVVAGLKTRLATYEAKLDEMVSEKVLAKEIEIKQATDEKIRIYKETEYSLQRQLNLIKDQLSNLQSSHDVTQAKLVDYSSQYDQEVAGKLGELEIVVADLERANQRAAHVQRENEVLKNELAALRGDASAMAASMQHRHHDWQDPATLQKKVKLQDAEIGKLLDELDKCRTKLSDRESYSARRINEVERELAVKKLETEELREKLLQFDDYERIKKELDVMKQIEFGNNGASSSAATGESDGLWGEDDEPVTGYATAVTTPGAELTLEKLLMDKNRKLQGEVSALKDSLDAQTAQLNHTTQDLSHAQLQSQTQKTLIAKLEEDVYKLNSIVASFSSGKTTATAAATSSVSTNASIDASADADPLLAINVRSNLNSQPDLVPILGKNFHSFVSVPSPGSTGISNQESGSSDSSAKTIVPILASQRDRYRQRNAELEEQAKSAAATIADLKYNMDSLKNDNIKLYEKLKYAESFQTPGSSGSRNNNHHAVTISAAGRTLNQFGRSEDDLSNRYNTLYESNLDPFSQFNRSEHRARVGKLNPAERAALVLTRVLAGNKYTRIGFVVYSVVLHLLVFATLFLLSQWEECRHDHVVPVPPGGVGAVRAG